MNSIKIRDINLTEIFDSSSGFNEFRDGDDLMLSESNFAHSDLIMDIIVMT